MRVKIIVERLYEELENEINEFISDKSVKDIKLTESEDFWSVLIMYEEDAE